GSNQVVDLSFVHGSGCAINPCAGINEPGDSTKIIENHFDLGNTAPDGEVLRTYETQLQFIPTHGQVSRLDKALTIQHALYVAQTVVEYFPFEDGIRKHQCRPA